VAGEHVFEFPTVRHANRSLVLFAHDSE